MARADGRSNDELRTVRITPGFQSGPAGSVLIETGRTRVACSVAVEQRVPPFLVGTGRGWLTAEYGMLPGSSPQRISRPIGKPESRAVEIQRLIGRSLRAMVDLDRLGEIQLTVDCDVIEADGGTRTAAITGAAVAVAIALARAAGEGKLSAPVAGNGLPLRSLVAATSVGIVEGELRLDLPYVEDSRAQVDCNVVMTADGGLIELQGTAEHGSFSRRQTDEMLDLAEHGIRQLFAAQRATLRQLGIIIPQ